MVLSGNRKPTIAFDEYTSTIKRNVNKEWFLKNIIKVLLTLVMVYYSEILLGNKE